MNILQHAIMRIAERLTGIVTEDEVISAVSSKNLPAGKCAVQVKRIGYTEILDPSVKPDGVARGDQVVAIVENGAIKTVLLRKSWSKSNLPEYQNIIK